MYAIENEFGAEGLKFEPVQPMRKWKMSYKGQMRYDIFCQNVDRYRANDDHQSVYTGESKLVNWLTSNSMPYGARIWNNSISIRTCPLRRFPEPWPASRGVVNISKRSKSKPNIFFHYWTGLILSNLTVEPIKLTTNKWVSFEVQSLSAGNCIHSILIRWEITATVGIANSSGNWCENHFFFVWGQKVTDVNGNCCTVMDFIRWRWKTERASMSESSASRALRPCKNRIAIA